ncbi:hypothetical protein HY570_00605 [Candidatus Micrarchaeota archaeon]|nr:hypothetical protein [Candidatus Micrarchaeota archaeon]
MKTLFLFVVMMGLVSAHGGYLQVADELFVQLSSAPISPFENQNFSLVISIGDRNGLLNEKVNGTVRIVRNEKVFLEKNFSANPAITQVNGNLETPGVYEIFITFNKESNPGKTYAPEDFLYEVKEIRKQEVSKPVDYVYIIVALGIGIVIGVLVNRFKRSSL